jgi:hypothetical protein
MKIVISFLILNLIFSISFPQNNVTLDIVLNADEETKIETIVENIPDQYTSILDDKYESWQRSTDVPEIQAQSNPSAYKTNEYYEFESYLLGLGNGYIALLMYYCLLNNMGAIEYVLLDITYPEYGFLWDEVKREMRTTQYTDEGIPIIYSHNSRLNLYFKKILARIRIVNKSLIINLNENPCNIDEWVAENYYFDAQILALREVYANNSHQFRDEVYIPSSIIERYLSLITSIYLNESDNSDSIFNEYSIHVFQDAPHSEITMIVDTTSSWLKTFIQDSTFSGNAVFDTILKKYDFKLSYYTKGALNGYLGIKSSKFLNLLPIKDSLLIIDDISQAELLEHQIGDGNDIRVQYYPDTAVISFSIGWGDCPAGCIYTHSWNYTVNYCAPTFIGWKGDTIVKSYVPSDTTVIGLKKNSEFTLYPNPVDNILIIESRNSEVVEIRIFSISGKLIIDQILNSKRLDLSSLDSGLYLIEIIAANRSDIHKIIKN